MIMGIDLSGNERRATGICILGENVDEVLQLKSDSDIIKKARVTGPDVVAIDAPLSFPEKGNLRKAEQELEKRRIKFVAPKGLIAAEQLVLRAMKLKDELKKMGVMVIEVNTGAFCDILRIPRKNNYLYLKRIMKLYGFSIPRKSYSQDEIDAVVAAFTGHLLLQARVEFVGDEKEGQIVVPKLK